MENTLKVFVLNMRGQPLMPCSPPKARKLLRAGKAVPVRRTPFVIQLTVPTGETKQSITLGVDAGYKHVGLSATTAKEELLASEVELRQDVTGLLSNRLALRRARRNRKTRCRAPPAGRQGSRVPASRRCPGQRRLGKLLSPWPCTSPP